MKCGVTGSEDRQVETNRGDGRIVRKHRETVNGEKGTGDKIITKKEKKKSKQKKKC